MWKNEATLKPKLALFSAISQNEKKRKKYERNIFFYWDIVFVYRFLHLNLSNTDRVKPKEK